VCVCVCVCVCVARHLATHTRRVSVGWGTKRRGRLQPWIHLHHALISLDPYKRYIMPICSIASVSGSSATAASTIVVVLPTPLWRFNFEQVDFSTSNLQITNVGSAATSPATRSSTSVTWDNNNKKVGTASCLIGGATAANEFIRLPNLTSADVSNGITVCMWARVTSFKTGYPRFFQFQNGSTLFTLAFYAPVTGTTNKGYLSLYDSGRGWQTIGTVNIADAQWQHFAYTTSASGSSTTTTTVYHNGIQIYQQGGNQFLTTSFNTNVIGTSNMDVGSESIKGNVDDFRLYNSVLNLSQINAIYAQTT
jgi:hypothetical protein